MWRAFEALWTGLVIGMGSVRARNLERILLAGLDDLQGRSSPLFLVRRRELQVAALEDEEGLRLLDAAFDGELVEAEHLEGLRARVLFALGGGRRLGRPIRARLTDRQGVEATAATDAIAMQSWERAISLLILLAAELTRWRRGAWRRRRSVGVVVDLAELARLALLFVRLGLLRRLRFLQLVPLIARDLVLLALELLVRLRLITRELRIRSTAVLKIGEELLRLGQAIDHGLLLEVAAASR